MSFCLECGKPMFTSNNGIWIDKKNYPIHKKCIRERQLIDNYYRACKLVMTAKKEVCKEAKE